MVIGTFWKRLSSKRLGILIQALSLIAIFFEGYDQGVMGGVNASPNYWSVVNIGNGVTADGVTQTTKQGGIVSIYYLGAVVGAFIGGWIADRVGRINGLFIAAVFALIGGALQSAVRSATFILVARVVTGLGTGALTSITPVYIAEVSSAGHRGGFLGYVFIANYLGISIAYWLNFGLSFIDNGNSQIRWRFLLAFQCIPAIMLLSSIKLLPDSPRYLASVGRYVEAKEVLVQLRGNDGPKVEREFMEICAVASRANMVSPIEFAKVIFGRATSIPHLGRRAWLCILLQIMASWTGITAVTAYSPVLLTQAGYGSIKQGGLAGGLNTIGIVGTIISAQIVDRFGRRSSLIWGAFGLFIVNLIAASLYEGARHNPSITSQVAPSSVTMLFLFNLTYAATWGTVAFLIPTEIFPSEMRAQGNSFGIMGWAIGVGWTVLVNPIMFQHLQSRTYFLFAGLNLTWMPIVYLFYPETSDRSLESINVMFSTKSPFYPAMEKAYLSAGNGDVLGGGLKGDSILQEVFSNDGL
ncbi:major facilitator superfamily transporter sugar [Rhodocollybia butyracea]|uniref:Major facilitator superfamily transporter sugar n=1 Tax=Rhodocollybia butyracea TaxID=206335 RepID=A0A9P5PAX8_9AGAR|nr:major facilitator superfamily transporter sugar [Rhodocollybia butyracea]